MRVCAPPAGCSGLSSFRATGGWLPLPGWRRSWRYPSARSTGTSRIFPFPACRFWARAGGFFSPRGRAKSAGAGGAPHRRGGGVNLVRRPAFAIRGGALCGEKKPGWARSRDRWIVAVLFPPPRHDRCCDRWGHPKHRCRGSRAGRRGRQPLAIFTPGPARPPRGKAGLTLKNRRPNLPRAKLRQRHPGGFSKARVGTFCGRNFRFQGRA